MKNTSHLVASSGAIILGFCASSLAQTPAFPGALGFGANATGGRNGTVYHVTTLADSGTGSFRDAVSHSGRIVVFDVGGTITLSSAVSCANNLTIAGQTAPGGGIAIIGHEVSFSARQNEIVRFLRIRPGSMQNLDEDAINVGDGTNMIFDHVSLEFAGYNNIDAHGNNGSDAITVQNSIIGDPMSNGTEAKQGFGAHTEHLGGTFSWYYNLWVSEHNRQPLAKIDTIFVNNTIYNFQDGYTVANTSGSFRHDIINNYFVTGPTDPSGGDAFFQMNANQSIYATGNLRDNNNDGALNGATIDPGGGGTVLTTPWSPLSTNATVFPTASAVRYDTSWAGAMPRDPLDALILSQVNTLGNGPAGTGAGTAGPGPGLYYDQTSTGLGNNGYGVVNGGVAPLDTDGDGMPDYWEKAVGLNPNLNDAMTIAADGYANIEHYLNWLAAPHALTVTNTPADADLWPFTGGFTNASPVYSVNNASNGAVALNADGHTAHFTPTADFFGLGSFQFSVVGSDGTACTNAVTVVVTPLAPPANLIWRGDGVSNLWAVGSGANFLDGTNPVAFASGANVTFDDTGSNTPPVALSGAISAGTVFVIADNQDYTFAGSGYLAGPTALFKTGTGQLTLDTTNTSTGTTIIDEGTVQVGDGLNFSGNLGGNITNNDTLIFNNPGPVTSTASLNGSGTLTKAGTGALTLIGTQTYTNTTTINAGSLQFSGTVPPSDMEDDGTLIFAPTSLTVYNNTISGSGNLVNSGSALIYLTGANTFTGGVTNNSGNLVLSNNAAAGSGPVIYNGGAVLVGGGVVITNDFSVPGSATTDLMMQGTNGLGIWAGNIVNLGSGAQWRPGADTGGQFEFTGNALMGSHILVVPRGSVQFASNAVVSSTVSGFLGRDTSGSGNNGNHRSANITIRDNASVAMAGCDMGGNKAGSSITVTLQDNGALSLGANTLELQNINYANAVSTLRLNGGTLTVGGFTKAKTSYTNQINFNGGKLVAAAGNASFLPAFNLQTALVQSGGAIIDDGGFAITIAAPLIHDALLGATYDGGLTKLGAGTLTLTASNTFTGDTLVSAGTLALSGNGSLAGGQNITVASGAALDVSQRSDGTLTVIHNGFPGQTLRGQGTIIGNVLIQNLLSPGLATGTYIGTLNFSNNLTFGAGCGVEMDITKSPLTNDRAKVAGTLTFGGALAVAQLDGNALSAGDSFKLFDAATYSGTFRSVTLPPLPSGLEWNTNSLSTNGTISVVFAPPVISSVLFSGNNFVFAGTNGVAGTNFYLLTSTNLSTPLSHWTRLLTNQFDGNGNFSVTNAVDANSPQDFYLLQLP